MTDPKLLYPRDLHPMDLEPHYYRHVSAMTAERLHSKADIAEQLAWRDQTIEALEKCLTDLHLFAGRGDGHETPDKVTDCIAGVIIQLRSDLARAESAEARVRELEAAEAAHVRRMNEILDKETKAIHKAWDEETDALESRITSLESEVARLREEAGLEAKALDGLGELSHSLRIRRDDRDWWASWWSPSGEPDRGDELRGAHAPALPALLRAILEVEKGGSGG